MHHVERYANNPIEADRGQLERRLEPMRGLHTDRTAQVVIAGQSFVQNLRRGHYDIELGTAPATRLGPDEHRCRWRYFALVSRV